MLCLKLFLLAFIPVILGAPAQLVKRQGTIGWLVKYNEGAWLKLNGVYSTIDIACDWFNGQTIGQGNRAVVAVNSASDPSRTRVVFTVEVPIGALRGITIRRSDCIYWFRMIQDKTAEMKDGVRQTRGGYAGFGEVNNWSANMHFDPQTK